MGFTSALPPFFLTADRITKKLEKLAKPAPGKKPRPPWDPTICSKFEQQVIGNAFFRLKADIDAIRKQGGDWVTLADLMKTQTVDSLSITCESDLGQPVSSNATSKSLNVSLDANNATLVIYWLTVEVVHLCGGTDLDAWAVKNWLYSIYRTASSTTYYPLLASEKALMCKGGTRLPSASNFLGGKFTIWDNMRGDLWPSTKNAQGQVGTFGPPGSSLIAGGAPKMYWQYACP